MRIPKFLFYCSILCFLFDSSFGKPVQKHGEEKRKSTENEDANNKEESIPEKKLKIDEEKENQQPLTTLPSKTCYFSTVRRNNEEKEERDTHSKVSTDCSGTVKRWEETLGTYSGNKFGAAHEMDLLAARGGAEYIDWSNPDAVNEARQRHVCDHHFEELVSGWEAKKFNHEKRTSHGEKKCAMHYSLEGHRRNTPLATHYSLLRDEAKYLLSDRGVHSHVGIPLCTNHKKIVSSIFASRHLEEAGTSAFEENTFAGSFHTTFYEGQAISDTCKSKFKEWIDSLRLSYASSRRMFPNLQKRSKKRKVIVAKYVFGLAMELLAPDHGEELKLLVTKDEENDWVTTKSLLFDDLMKSISEEYRKADSRLERRAVLSIAAGMLNYPTVLEYFPGLTKYSYNKARRYSKLSNRQDYQSSKRQKYIPSKVVEFVNFITSDFVSTDLPFGRRVLRKTDGTKLDVPDTLRIVRAVEIVEMYIKLKTEQGEGDELLSRSSLFKILDACKATTREALQCVDYFVSDALDAFDSIIGTIDDLKEKKYIDKVTARNLVNRFLEVKQYLRTDFKLHIKLNSKVRDHCIKHSLTDTNDHRFSSSCSTGSDAHDHDMFCERCQMMHDVFFDYEEILKHLLDEAKNGELGISKTENKIIKIKLEEQLNDCLEAKKAIQNLKKHEVRNIHIQLQRRKIVESLLPTDAFLTLDWSQKFLPMQSREAQSDYFGKSGISIHVIHALTVDSVTKAFKQHNFIHIMQQDLQDATAVLLIVEHTLRELKKVGIKRVFIRSDNAGCYHSSSFIASVPEVMKKTGVQIKSVTFSEPQGGKGPADRSSNEIKNKIRKWVASKHNAETPREVYQALTEGRVLKAMSAYLCSIDSTKTRVSNTPINLVSQYYDFQFSEKIITIRKFGEIGEGMQLDSTRLTATTGEMNIEQSGGFLPSSQNEFWKESVCKSNCKAAIEHEESNLDNLEYESNRDIDDEHPQPLKSTSFECPEETCDAQFLTAESLDNHLATNEHFRRPEKENMLDFAMSRYSENLENWKSEMVSTNMKEVMKQASVNTVNYNVEPSGWAHPSKKTHSRYSKEAVIFAKNKFEEARKSGSKVYTKEIAKEMRTAKKGDGVTPKFKNEELLNYKQITSLYHRFGKMKSTAPTSTTTKSPAVQNKAKSNGGKKKSGKSKRSQDVTENTEISEDDNIMVDKLLDSIENQELDDSEFTYDNDESHPNLADIVLKNIQPIISEIFVVDRKKK